MIEFSCISASASLLKYWEPKVFRKIITLMIQLPTMPFIWGPSPPKGHGQGQKVSSTILLDDFSAHKGLNVSIRFQIIEETWSEGVLKWNWFSQNCLYKTKQDMSIKAQGLIFSNKWFVCDAYFLLKECFYSSDCRNFIWSTREICLTLREHCDITWLLAW